MILQWPAPAKLNLFLYVTGRRADGYHLLQTLFQFLDYSDTLIIKPNYNGCIRLVNSITGIKEQNNVIIHAANLLKRNCLAQNCSKMLGADIKLEKVLPIGGGLGGGSSNAATVLVALNKQWQCGLNITTLSQLGLSLGADVPIFIHGHTAFAEGIGEILNPITLAEKWYLVSVPSISLSTQYIFSRFGLKRNTPRRSFAELISTPFYNDCEPIVIKHFPIIAKHLSWLLKYAPSRLTGTGSCVFAEFDNESSARQVLSQAPIWMRGFVARGVSISPLLNTLLKLK